MVDYGLADSCGPVMIKFYNGGKQNGNKEKEKEKVMELVSMDNLIY